MKKITYLLLFLVLISWQGIAQTTHSINWEMGISSTDASLTIDVGDTVEWIFNDAMSHTVTSLGGSTETFDSGIQASGYVYSYTFTTAGTNPYECSLHPSMAGTITVNASSGSANDNLANAISLTVDATCSGDLYDNTGATTETGEPSGSCHWGGDVAQTTVWFKFVAPASGSVSITTDILPGNLGDSQLAVFPAPTNINDLTTLPAEIGCDEDSGDTNVPSGLMSYLELNSLTAGNTYYIQVDGYAGDEGGFCIEVASITPTVAPPNDDLVNAISLTVDASCTGDLYTNAGATAQTNEPLGSCFYPSSSIDNSVWFSFIAPASGNVTITTDILPGDLGDSEIAVYPVPTDVNDLSTLPTEIDCDQDDGDVNVSSGWMSYLELFGLTAGSTYYIQVDGYDGAEGGFCIEVAELSCIVPVNIQNTATTTTTADFSWDAVAGASDGYNWIVMADGDDPLLDTPVASGSVATGNTTQAIGLSSGTAYDFYVQSDCGAANGTSDWSIKLDFTTTCTTVTSFFENFDSVTTPAFPSCWSKVGTSGSANTQTTNPSSSPNTLYIYGSSSTSQAVVSMPIISNLGAGTHRFRFNMRANFTVGGIIEVGYLTNPTDATTFTSISTVTANSLTYIEYIVNIPVGTYSNYPAFRHTGSPAYSVLIDDVNWELQPSCIAPVNVQNTAVTPLTADFSWDAETTAISGYNWVVMADGDDPDVDTPVASGSVATGTTAQATGLAAQTNYDFYVQSNCGTTNGTSMWSAKVDFMTDPSCLKPTNVMNTASFDTTADFSWDVEPNATTGYNWVVMADGDDPYVDTPLFSGSAPTGTTTVQVTGLTTDSIYDFYVQSNCGTTDGLSDWSDKVDFYTGYCPSQPSSNDGTGYGDIDVETTTFNDNADSTYENYTSSPVTIGLSEVIDIQIDLNTGFGYDYDYHIWVDYNNDLIFDNATEIVATGATAGAPDEVITASFTFSGTMAGSYRMRIASADTGQATPDPCYNSSYGNTADFVLELVIPCDAASGVMTTAFDQTTADFSWAPSQHELNGYNWVVMADGDDPMSDTPVDSGTTATGVTTASATGLTANTAYDFYVQTNCVSGAISDWSTVLDFMTATCDEPTAVTLDNATGSTLDISWTASATETDGYNWILMNDGESPITDTPVDSGSVATGITMVNITGLTNLTAYDFYVQTNCGNGNVSNWILFEVSTVRTDAEIFRGFEYYPNPVNAELILKAPSEMTQVVVYNLLGQKVMSVSPNNLETRLDFSAIQTGSYMVQIHINDSVKTIRIIKE